MLVLLLLPLGLQGLAMAVDEGWFHRRRGLPRWERLGHPIDTLTMVACVGWLVGVAPTAPDALLVYGALAVVSTLVITKDEPVHARLCGPGEHWLHAVLFVLHPIVLAALGLLWWRGHHAILVGQLALTLAFLAYQVGYWCLWPVLRAPRAVPGAAGRPVIDNAWYAALGARWYEATDTPIALLRAEARHRNPWIHDEIARVRGPGPQRVLDLGCGGGLLANDLAARGHHVTGLDTTPENLAVAAAHDATGTVRYVVGDALALPFDAASFDVVCAMDLLEHVEEPGRLVAEAARVLAPGGVFVFHTFNRTWQANLIVIHGVRWFVANAPPDLHVLHLFLTPAEVRGLCAAHGLGEVRLIGARPRFTWPLLRMVLTRRVGDDVAFTFTPSTRIGFTGTARKRE